MKGVDQSEKLQNFIPLLYTPILAGTSGEQIEESPQGSQEMGPPGFLDLCLDGVRDSQSKHSPQYITMHTSLISCSITVFNIWVLNVSSLGKRFMII